MLGEPNPCLEVDLDGTITKIVNVRVCDNNGTLLRGQPVHRHAHHGHRWPAHTITVDDIIYDHGAQGAVPRQRPHELGGPAATSGAAAGVFEFQQTWDFVKLINASSLNMVTNIIDVVNTTTRRAIDIRVDTIPTGTGTNSAGSLENVAGTSFDFDIEYTFPPTLVLIRTRAPFSAARSRQPVHPARRLHREPDRDDAGSTTPSGDILSGAGTEIIRTNVLDLDAPHGDIGHQSPTHANPDPVRNPIMVELVKFKHPDPTSAAARYRACTTSSSRSTPAGRRPRPHREPPHRRGARLGCSTVTIDHINAGDDVDLVLNDSKNGNDASALVARHDQPLRPGDALLPLRLPVDVRPGARDGARQRAD